MQSWIIPASRRPDRCKYSNIQGEKKNVLPPLTLFQRTGYYVVTETVVAQHVIIFPQSGPSDEGPTHDCTQVVSRTFRGSCIAIAKSFFLTFTSAGWRNSILLREFSMRVVRGMDRWNQEGRPQCGKRQLLSEISSKAPLDSRESG